MPKKNDLIIKIIAAIFVLYGVIIFFPNLRFTLWLLQYPFSGNTLVLENLFYTIYGLILNFIIPLAAIICGVGLLKQKEWSYTASLLVTLILFILSLAGIINFLIMSYRLKDISMPEGSLVKGYSMIPTYLECIFSMIIFVILMRKRRTDARWQETEVRGQGSGVWF